MTRRTNRDYQKGWSDFRIMVGASLDMLLKDVAKPRPQETPELNAARKETVEVIRSTIAKLPAPKFVR